MGVDGQRYYRAAFPPGNNPYPLYRSMGGQQGQSGWVRKFSPVLGFDLRTVQAVATYSAG